MSTNSKVSQDSDEYRKWKDGVSKSSSKLKSPSEIEEVDFADIHLYGYDTSDDKS